MMTSNDIVTGDNNVDIVNPSLSSTSEMKNSDDIRITINNNMSSDVIDLSASTSELREPIPKPAGSSNEMMNYASTSGLRKPTSKEIMTGDEAEPSASTSLPCEPTPTGSFEEEVCSIHRVPHRLREVKPIAYEPNVISIGPYHYGKEHLGAMEDKKRFCFSKVVVETNLQFEDFAFAMRNLKERALNCYEGPISPVLDDDKFIEMMVHDGCLIVQLIRNSYTEYFSKLGRHIQTDMWYDLLLLENQLPFFVLVELDRIIMENGPPDDDRRSFSDAAFSFFQKKAQKVADGPQIWPGNEGCPSSILHLLDLVHKCCRPSLLGISLHEVYSREVGTVSHRSWKFIRSATELADAGIDFLGKVVQDEVSVAKMMQHGVQGPFDIIFTEKDEDSLSLHSVVMKIIKIQNKVMRIPALRVDDNTERMLRNLLAYEQFSQIGEPTYVYDYVMLMDNLINTDKDVQLLCTSGVIDNWLGDDEAVAQMFNRLRDKTYSSEDFYYAEIFDKVDKHCNQKWNNYKAILKEDYFGSPWSLCAFGAALVLLLATLLQTAYACIGYYHPNKG